MSWKSVAICDCCWVHEEGNRTPIRIKPEFVEPEPCYNCGKETTSGIFVRRDV